jgi:hypothetical protein
MFPVSPNLPGAFPQNRGHGLKRQIAFLMPPRVVDFLVKVREMHGRW